MFNYFYKVRNIDTTELDKSEWTFLDEEGDIHYPQLKTTEQGHNTEKQLAKSFESQNSRGFEGSLQKLVSVNFFDLNRMTKKTVLGLRLSIRNWLGKTAKQATI